MRPAMDGEIIEGQSILLFVGLNFFDWYSSSARSGGARRIPATGGGSAAAKREMESPRIIPRAGWPRYKRR